VCWVACRSPEEALVHTVVEARRAAPAILFLPHLQASQGPGCLAALPCAEP
jgi:hypothetical protein